jgi:transposase
VKDWLEQQTDAFRKAVKVVVIDPSAPYASGIRAALPDALMGVDGWHLVALANQTVSEVRQRVTREQLGRRGTVADPMWVTAGCCSPAPSISVKQRDRCRLGSEVTSPTAAETARAVQVSALR